jgi:hypothetical protein
MEWADATEKRYEIKQFDDDGAVISSFAVEAASSEAAAKQLREVDGDTCKIAVCLDGEPMNEMGVDYWKQRVRRR